MSHPLAWFRGFDEVQHAEPLPGLPAGSRIDMEVFSADLGYILTKSGDIVGIDGKPFHGFVSQQHLDMAEAIRKKEVNRQ